MADIRIKDLATLESASLTGDVFVIDGTTGTRKLSAFSPTFGGNATVTGTLTTNGYTFTSGTLSSFSSTAGIYNYYSGGVGVIASYSDGSGTRAQTQIAGSTVLLNTAAGNALTVSAAGVVAIPATTASTSTSTGALVVSGGVGVAGAMNVGGSMKLNYFSTVGDPTALGVVQLYATTNTTSGAGGIEWKADAGGDGYGYRTLTVFDGVSAYDLYTQVRTNSASWTNSLILKSNGNATFSGSVQTSAPSGGTAAAWKLGTVATVSPTSPNRTIEVDIGGTIYYIHAKTTNN